MKIEQNHWLAVAKGQGEDGAPHRFLARLFRQGIMLGRGCGGLGRGFKGQDDGGKPLQFGAEDVGRESEEPGGKAGFAPPLG
jgi:hypothetical protein